MKQGGGHCDSVFGNLFHAVNLTICVNYNKVYLILQYWF